MHHAYLYEGQMSLLAALAKSAQEMFGFELGDPDLHILEWEKFGIEESRDLTHQASFKPLSSKALFVVGVSSITPEAQQALLKLFEEPQPGVAFVVLAPYGSIIATLRSRFLAYPHVLNEENTHVAAAKKFLSSIYKDRSTQLAALIKDEEGAKERTRDFLQALEALLYAKSAEAEYREGLRDIALVRDYASDRSASLKMLLEYLAAVLPIL